MIKKEEIEKLATLSRLTLTDDEISAFQKDIDAILEYVSRIQKAGIHASPMAETAAVQNVFREDGDPHTEGMYTDDITTQFPKEKDGYLNVKKILGSL